jgi:mRNA interferase RelE/StbE
VRYHVRLSHRAAKDLDKLSGDARDRILHRLEQLAEDPFDPRLSSQLTNQRGLRKSRVGGWRIIFAVDEEHRILDVVTVERRGQVYQRI